jgi:hypothetical protein
MSQNIFTDGLGYEGKVTLTLKSNNHVLKSKTYKNHGTALLFKFLGYCLIGEYEEVKHLLPYKIRLLNNKSGSQGEISPTNVTHSSYWQPYSQTPTIVSDGNSDQVKVMYSFEVPRNIITDEFNQIALYSVDADDISDFSAYYYLVNANDKLETLNIADWSTTTVLLVEWELTISNKNTETNTMGGE